LSNGCEKSFPNGKLKEEVYVKQHLGFESSEFPNHVFKLDKPLYVLKQAPRSWFNLKGYSDSDYVGCNMNRKSTLNACHKNIVRFGLGTISISRRSRNSRCQSIQTTILQHAAFQTDDLDAYDSNYDDISSAKVVLMANLSSYDSDVLSEVPQHDTYQNDNMINQSVQETQYFEQSLINYVPDNEITSDSNIISYEQYLQEMQNEIVQNANSSVQQDAMIMSMFEQMSNQVTNCDKINQENKLVNESLIAEIERYKERV
nr:retrovirus-related Pol polyprotein from transposon TNT 1-94 [Tanacetum cinerariifolium]